MVLIISGEKSFEMKNEDFQNYKNLKEKNGKCNVNEKIFSIIERVYNKEFHYRTLIEPKNIAELRMLGLDMCYDNEYINIFLREMEMKFNKPNKNFYENLICLGKLPSLNDEINLKNNDLFDVEIEEDFSSNGFCLNQDCYFERLERYPKKGENIFELNIEDKRHNKFNILSYLKDKNPGVKNNVCIAGGYISSLYNYCEIQSNADIDIFLYDCENDEHALGICKEIMENANYMIDHLVITSSAINFQLIVKIGFSTYYYKIQIIRRIYETPSQIIHGFDTDNSCILYNFKDSTLYCTERFMYSYKYKVVTLNFHRLSPSYFYRINKAIKRGYNLEFPKQYLKYFYERKIFDQNYYKDGCNFSLVTKFLFRNLLQRELTQDIITRELYNFDDKQKLVFTENPFVNDFYLEIIRQEGKNTFFQVENPDKQSNSSFNQIILDDHFSFLQEELPKYKPSGDKKIVKFDKIELGNELKFYQNVVSFRRRNKAKNPKIAEILKGFLDKHKNVCLVENSVSCLLYETYDQPIQFLILNSEDVGKDIVKYSRLFVEYIVKEHKSFITKFYDMNEDCTTSSLLRNVKKNEYYHDLLISGKEIPDKKIKNLFFIENLDLINYSFLNATYTSQEDYLNNGGVCMYSKGSFFSTDETYQMLKEFIFPVYDIENLTEYKASKLRFYLNDNDLNEFIRKRFIRNGVDIKSEDYYMTKEIEEIDYFSCKNLKETISIFRKKKFQPELKNLLYERKDKFASRGYIMPSLCCIFQKRNVSLTTPENKYRNFYTYMIDRGHPTFTGTSNNIFKSTFSFRINDCKELDKKKYETYSVTNFPFLSEGENHGVIELNNSQFKVLNHAFSQKEANEFKNLLTNYGRNIHNRVNYAYQDDSEYCRILIDIYNSNGKGESYYIHDNVKYEDPNEDQELTRPYNPDFNQFAPLAVPLDNKITDMLNFEFYRLKKISDKPYYLPHTHVISSLDLTSGYVDVNNDNIYMHEKYVL